MSNTRRVAIFGGTFDPVHLGHIAMAEQARMALALDEVMFLPCRISPHKTGTQPADGQERMAMLNLAIARLPWASINPLELCYAEPSYSWRTADIITMEEPDTRWFWLMGGDQWEALPRWSHPERLAELVEFIVVAREGILPKPRTGYRMHVVNGGHPASATAIRQSAKDGALREDWLDPEVARYIGQRNLYR